MTSSDETKYEYAKIKSVRGTEARTISKKQDEGWELVGQEPGRLRTALSFRRPKPKVAWQLWAAAGALGVVLIVGAVVATVLEDGDAGTATEAAATSSVAQSEPAPAPPSDPGPETKAVALGTAEMLTVENNVDLANLLWNTESCSPAVADFANRYAGRTIQFDGHISALNNHGEYKTRYDFGIAARDFNESDGAGPSFQFRNIEPISDLSINGPNQPDALTVLDTLKITAVVDEYEEQTCLFLLDPVAAEMR